MSIRIRFRQFVYLRNAASPPKIRMITISCPRINERTIFQLSSGQEVFRRMDADFLTLLGDDSRLVPAA